MSLLLGIELVRKYSEYRFKSKPKPKKKNKKNNMFSNFRRYTTGMIIGMCFEYVYRVESDIWYIPLTIAIVLTISMVVDIISSK